ncbi:hypothetical protein H5073_17960 [Shewanella sp. SR44-3]|nr:hypothetical protein [Shewanella sp. SR44-3]
MQVDEEAYLKRVYRIKTEQEIKSDKMMNVYISDAWVSYLANIRCTNFTTTYGKAWNKGHFLSKDYSFTCTYYDRVEQDYNGQRKFSISYRFLTSADGNKDILNAREHELINGVKTIMSNLQIKNMDVERMKREGLYFESQPFFVPEHALLPL